MTAIRKSLTFASKSPQFTIQSGKIMVSKCYSCLVFLLCFALLGNLVNGQSTAQKERLREMAETSALQFQLEKNAALSRFAEAGLPVRNTDPDGSVWELMRLRNGRPVYFITQNANGATVIKSDRVYPGGGAGLSLTGSGQLLGVWDEAKVLSTHQELTGRVTQKDSPATFSDHATHVAGTMIASGVTALAKGMSYQASIDARDWNDDFAEMAAAASSGLKVSQHSYGEVTGWYYGNLGAGTNWYWLGDPSISAVEDYRFGFYDAGTRTTDEIAFNAPQYLIVKSAGNDRDDDPGNVGHWIWVDESWVWSTAVRNGDGAKNGFDCIPVVGTAKNIMTVGAVYNTGAMAYFSSWGPTDDGRIKPDIVAKGVGVYSASSAGNTSYVYKSGTSMSGPMVSGSVGLLLHHQENLHPGVPLLSSTIKALILHTADDLGNPGPDYSYGWGMMNTENAAAIMTQNAAKSGEHIYELTLNNGGEISIPMKSSGIEALKATIAWTDVPGTPPDPSLNPSTLMLVNDLDMRLWSMTGDEFEPYILDPANPTLAATTGDNFRDNVEIINIETPGTDKIYLLTIRHKGLLSGGSQQFSLIITGNEPFEYQQVSLANDKSVNYSSWNNYSNGGYGFNTWQFAAGGGGGSYLGGTGLGSSTFGIYSGGSNPGDYFVARRDFEEVMPVSSTFSLNLGYTSVATGGEIGISLFSGTNFRLTFKFIGGSSQWVINDGGSDFGTGIPWSGNTPLNFHFTRREGNKYSLLIKQGMNTFTAENYIASSGEMSVTRIEIFSSRQGSGENVGFDDLNLKSDLDNLSFDATLLINEDAELTQNLNIQNLLILSGKNLQVNADVALTVTGELGNLNSSSKSGLGLRIKSNASGAGSMIHSSIGVNGTVERYLPGYTSKEATGWHLLSSPVNNLTIAGSDFAPGNVSPNLDDFFAWDEVNYLWLNQKLPANNITSFVNGKGYLVAYESTNTKDFEGAFNSASITFEDLSKTISKGNGWHLLGNPFQAALKWETANWSRTQIGPGAKIMNPGGTYTDITVGGANEYIPANQGFFVQALDADNAITIPTASRTHNSTPFYKSEIPSLLTLRAADGEFYVETWIQMMDEATANYDQNFDVRFIGGVVNSPQLYSKLSDTERVSTNRISDFEEELVIPLGFKSFLNREFTFTASDAASFGENVEVYLVDAQKGSRINLKTNPAYTFTAVANELTERFSIHLLKSTGVNDVNPADGLRIFYYGSEIFINPNENADARISIFNITGQQVYSNRMMLDGIKQLTLNVPTGWYVVKVIAGDAITSRKVFIR